MNLNMEIAPFECNPGGQFDFWCDWEPAFNDAGGRVNRFWFLEGGWASGKTFIGARKLLAGHVWNAFDAEGEPTFVPSAVVGPTYRAMDDFQLPQLKDGLREMGLSYEWREGDKELVLPDLGTRDDPSRLIFRTAEKPETITGWEVGFAWGDEAARWKEDRENPLYDPYVQLTGRVRHPRSNYRGLIFTYTNEGDHTRIYEEAHSGKPGHAVYRARTRDNMTASIQEFYNTQLGLLNPLTAEQYLDGGAMNLRGARCYSVWDSVFNRLPIGWKWNYNLPLVLTLDFNIAPGMHGVIGQRNKILDEAYCVREIFRPRLDLPGLMNEFKQYLITNKLIDNNKFMFPMLEIHGDATGSSDSAQTGESCYHVVRRFLDEMKIPYAIKISGQNPLIVDRTLAMNCAFRDMDGKAHLFINNEQCPRLVEDLKFVRYDEKGVMDKSNQNYTHASDAVGYWIYYVRPVRVKPRETKSRFAMGNSAGAVGGAGGVQPY